MTLHHSAGPGDPHSVAVIGMAGRFPDARSVDEFWRNLRNGVESIRTFTEQELATAGVPADLLQDKNYVRRGTVIADIDSFDADFFGISPRDAEVTDPQQRVFMEVAWEALEHSGYAPGDYSGAVGLFAGTASSQYFMEKIWSNGRLAHSVNSMQVEIGNDKDYLCSRVAYHFGLRGPTVTVQTACSTSLVAVHLACQSILNGESDIALAGGVCLAPHAAGYLYQPGGNVSADGRCRTFDEKASGTVPGSGVGLVVLKSLARALEDGNTIHAIIRGSAINNDAADKVGFTAPSVSGQAAVITEAMAVADVKPESISYVEAHGTGTLLGDPIEMRALQQAFATCPHEKPFCAVGSVKTNIGHLNVAAGVAGLIKTVLTVREREIVPSLHFSTANPHIVLANSPFYVNTSLQRMPSTTQPLRAGVSSFGIGGTNAHVIVEEPPREDSSPPTRASHLLLLSAKTPEALQATSERLEHFLKDNPRISLADTAYTLQVGRTPFRHRRALVCSSTAEAVRQIAEGRGVIDGAEAARSQGERGPVVFMFPGQGAQYTGMGRDLYRTEEVFHTEVDRCARLLSVEVGFDLRTVLFGDGSAAQPSQDRLDQTQIAQPALFTIEYALARQLEHWGVRPDALVGHSVGEYVAACLAGVFSLEDALRLVARRGALIAELPSGKMLAVRASESELQRLMMNGLWIAAVNAPDLCSVSGTHEAVEALEQVLLAKGVEFQRLHTSHAFHSGMMDPVLESFGAAVSRVPRNAPRIPIISNVSGTWMTSEQAISGSYWCEHLRRPVQFSKGVRALLQRREPLFVEVGPGRSLVRVLRQHGVANRSTRAVGVVPDAQPPTPSIACLLDTLGWLWTQGVPIDWARFHDRERRRRIPLPTYPFARQRHWIGSAASEHSPTPVESGRRIDVDTWFYAPTWKRTLEHRGAAMLDGQSSPLHLILADRHGCSQPIIDALRARGARVIMVTQGSDFRRVSPDQLEIRAADPSHYERSLSVAFEQSEVLEAVTHFWSITAPGGDGEIDPDDGFSSLRFLAAAVGSRTLNTELTVNVVSNGLFAVWGDETLVPGKAILLGPSKLLGEENKNVRTRCVDITLAESGIDRELATRVAQEMAAPVGETTVAFRGRHRWSPVIEPVRAHGISRAVQAAGEHPHYLITGGLGVLGYAFARYLAENRSSPALTLIGRHPLPPQAQWAEYLATHAEDEVGSRKIRQLQALKALGASVMYLTSDVADEQAVNRMADVAFTTFGPCQGIFHAAGYSATAAPAVDAPSPARPALASKVAGAIHLRKVFDFSRLDFVILNASIDSILPLAGQADAAAAGAFLDALAYQESTRGHEHVMCVKWAHWEELPRPPTGDALDIAALTPSGFSADEVRAVFDRVLAMRVPDLIVSPLDYRVLAQHAADINRLQAPADRPRSADAGALAGRDGLATAYAAPGTDTEKILVDIWQSVLGITPIGIHDDFFDLGGHSLMATQVLSRVRQELKVTLALKSLFNATTVAALAVAVDTARIQEEAARREQLAVARESLQKSIDAMSPDQIAALLAQKKQLKANEPPAV